MVLGLDALVMIVGLLMFALSKNPDVKQIGYVMFFCGLFTLLLSGDRVVALLR